MRLALGVTVLATATACGGKKADPYERSDGLVRQLVIRSGKAVVTYDFSRYGEKVSVTVPRVKGFK